MEYNIEQFNFFILANAVDESTPTAYNYLKQNALNVCSTLYALPPGKKVESDCKQVLSENKLTWYSFRITEETSSQQEKLKYQLLQELNKKLEHKLFLIENARTGKEKEEILNEIILIATGFASLNTNLYYPIARSAKELLDTLLESDLDNDKLLEDLKSTIKTRSFNSEWDIWAEKEGREKTGLIC